MMLLNKQSAVAAFSPTNVSGLIVWLKADSITSLSDADPVVTWTDSSSNAYAFTQGTPGSRPTYKVNIVNGKPVVRFDGTDDYLRVATAGISTASGAIYVVATSNNVTPATTAFATADEASGTRWLQGPTPVSGLVHVAQSNNDTADDIIGDTTLVNGTWYVIAIRSSGTAYSMQVNATVQGLTVGGGANTGDWGADITGLDNMAVGALVTNSVTQPWNGDIAEVLVYSANPSAGDHASIMGYLGAKYAITVV